MKDIVRKFIKSLRGEVDMTIKSTVSYIQRELKYSIQNYDSKNVYQRDWDLLIILDCATVDMMKEVADEYNFINRVGYHISPATCSNMWMYRTFVDEFQEEMSQTVHVTANTSSETRLNSDSFLQLEEVWRDGWDAELGTIPAQEVTDRAIHLGRKYNSDRMIVHYMQPHLPFVGKNINSNIVTPEGKTGNGKDIKELFEDGYSSEYLWNASIDNLRYVLDNIGTLLSNLDADRVVLSSDHGQAFGEQGVWGHPCHTYIDVLRYVPWCVTTAEDTNNYNPDINYDDANNNISLEEKLEALGYR